MQVLCAINLESQVLSVYVLLEVIFFINMEKDT